MSSKSKKESSDVFFIKGGSGDKLPDSRSLNHDDIALLALQLSCPQRLEPGKETQYFENVHEIHNLIALTVETRLFSSLILLGSHSSRYNLDELAANLAKQLRNIIKSAQEKIYFIEHFRLVDPTQLDWNFFVRMSDYCFMQDNSKGPAFMGYFRLEKTKDEERFASRAVNSMVEGEVAEQDVYLHFTKNNRYIKILKKGEALEKKRMDRLNSRGVKDIYTTVDQGVEAQQRRVRLILLDLIEDYSALVNAV